MLELPSKSILDYILIILSYWLLGITCVVVSSLIIVSILIIVLTSPVILLGFIIDPSLERLDL